MMKYLTTLLAVMFCTGTIARSEDNAVPRETIHFDGQTLILASKSGNASESVKEFLLSGENFKSWTKLASIREYPKLNDPKAVVANLIQMLKQQNPEAPSAVVENPKTKEVIVDFITWPSDQSFVEFNVFKYSKRDGGGLLAQQYAIREYHDTATFLKGLKPVRKHIIDLMAKGGFKVNK